MYFLHSTSQFPSWQYIHCTTIYVHIVHNGPALVCHNSSRPSITIAVSVFRNASVNVPQYVWPTLLSTYFSSKSGAWMTVICQDISPWPHLIGLLMMKVNGKWEWGETESFLPPTNATLEFVPPEEPIKRKLKWVLTNICTNFQERNINSNQYSIT